MKNNPPSCIFCKTFLWKNKTCLYFFCENGLKKIKIVHDIIFFFERRWNGKFYSNWVYFVHLDLLQMNWFILGRQNSSRWSADTNLKVIFPAYDLMLFYAYLDSEKLIFSVKKASKTNMDDYQPVWMNFGQYVWLTSGIDDWKLDDFFGKFIRRKQYFNLEQIYHLCRPIITLSGWVSSPVVDFHLV
jgi:hypothetical protein